MTDLTIIDGNELEERMQTVLSEIDSLIKDIGPKLQKIGQLRVESAVILKELEKRGLAK